MCADDEASLARSTHDGGCTAGKSRGSIAAQADGEEKIAGFSTKEAVKTVTTHKSYTIEGTGKHIAVMDFGIKTNIIRNFKKSAIGNKLNPI